MNLIGTLLSESEKKEEERPMKLIVFFPPCAAEHLSW